MHRLEQEDNHDWSKNSHIFKLAFKYYSSIASNTGKVIDYVHQEEMTEAQDWSKLSDSEY